jgi:hypothetical protein
LGKAARELAIGGWQFEVKINWLPDFNENTLKERFQKLRNEAASQKVINKTPFGLPQRLWQILGEQSGVLEDMRWADLPAKVQNQFIRNLVTYELAIKGKNDFQRRICDGRRDPVEWGRRKYDAKQDCTRTLLRGRSDERRWHYRGVQFSARVDEWVDRCQSDCSNFLGQPFSQTCLPRFLR